jgi:P27 family predicted phage terminase small subunit
MRKKPVKLKLLEGNPGKRPLQTEPEAPAGVPDMPEHLDAYAREEWRRVAPGQASMGIMSTVDQGTLAAYCSAYSRWRAAEEELAELRKKGRLNALILQTIQGNYIQQPLIGISNCAARDMVMYAAQLGMTPIGRAKLAVDPVPKRKAKFEGLVGVQGGKK